MHACMHACICMFSKKVPKMPWKTNKSQVNV